MATSTSDGRPLVESAQSDAIAFVQTREHATDSHFDRPTQQSVGGRDPAPDVLARRPQGRDSELGRALARARTEQRLLGIVENPVRTGRFVMLERLGRGAMGVVYAAYDPKLDRKVAIKLVDASALGSEVGDAQARLEREAKAAANLAHPNVVTVYDVGVHDGRVFLAMQLVPEGRTLTRWLASEPRSWQEVVRMFVAVGRGIAAAHDAGIVHRDFKPDNVLVTQDGQPLVADFGLARPVDGWTTGDCAPTPAGTRDSAALASTGSVCGTPAYMAPEQFDGTGVGPHSDQYGLCTALFEALFGYRPHSGNSVSELAMRVRQEQVSAPPSGHPVPRPVVALVLQGLRVDADARHRNVATLIDALERVLTARRRRRQTYAAAILAGAGLLGGYQAHAASQVDPCLEQDSAIDTAWSPERRNRVERALTPQTEQASAQLVDALDGYAQRWREQQQQSCTATRVDATQTEFAMELREACFARAAVRMHGVAEELALGDGAFRRPERLVSLLAPLSECENVEALEQRSDRLRRGGLSPQEAAASEEGLVLLSMAETRTLLGRPGAPALLEEALALFEAADFKTLQGVVLYKLGELSLREGAPKRAASQLERASGLLLSTAHDEDAAAVAILSANAAHKRGKTSAAALHLAYARGLIGRIMHEPTRDYFESMVAVQAAELAHERGDNAEALALIEDGAPRLIEHPHANQSQITKAYEVLGIVREGAGDPAGAAQAWADGMRSSERAGVTESQQVAYQHGNLAVAYMMLHRFAEARHHSAEYQRIVAALYGDDHLDVAAGLANWGYLEREAGDLSAARVKLNEALRLFERADPESHGAWPLALEELADVDRREGRFDDALERLARAKSMRESMFEAGHPGMASPLTHQGRVYVERGQPERAVEPLSQAIGLLSRPGAMSEAELAETELVLARALADTDPARSKALLTAAQTRLPPNLPPPARYAADYAILLGAS